MRIKLKIKDVEGMTDDGRHILLVDAEELRRCLLEERRKFTEELLTPEIRNQIYMQEKAKHDAKEQRRKADEQAKKEKADRHAKLFFDMILNS